jgi:peptidoglycan/LPS O-acetylase OafA/YrhL
MTFARAMTWPSLTAAKEPTAAFTPGWLARHIPALDGLRGLAILLVTLFRFSQQFKAIDGPLDDAATRLVTQGYRGVDLFFVLSGFLITGILYDTKQAPHYFRDFYVRRSLRIFPLYYAVLLVLLAATLLAPQAIANSPFAKSADNAPWLWLYGANIVQSLQNSWMLGPLNHFWSLAVEEHFYLVWPLAIYYLSRRQAMVLCVGLAGIALTLRAALAAQGQNVAAEVLTFCRMDALCMGAFLSLYLRGPVSPSKATWSIAVSTAVSAIFLLTMYGLSRRFLTIADTLVPVFCAGAIYCAVAGTKTSPVRWLMESTLLRMLGRYSYGMYVYQSILIPLVPLSLTASAFAAASPSLLAAKIVYIGVMAVTTLLLAMLSFHCFEQPFLSLKDRLAPKPE